MHNCWSLCLYFASVQGASSAGINVLRQPIAPPIPNNFWHRRITPAICNTNTGKHLLPTVCAAQGFGGFGAKKQVEKKKKPKWQLQTWEATEEEQAAIRSALGYANRWEDLAKKWKQAAESATETGFLMAFQNGQSKEQAKTTAQFTKRQASEAEAKGLPGVAKAWSAVAKAWGEAAQSMEVVAVNGWSAPAAKSVGAALKDTALLIGAAGEKFQGAASAWTESEEEMSKVTEKLGGTLVEMPLQTSPGFISMFSAMLVGLFVGSGAVYTVLRFHFGRTTTSTLL
eukprot:gnl/MRDRNA2_/MRDRNA2_42214_c0_seq1.p1 gnl/MRDRNA2_/MRDRNA2_42214_c0~~gnl/MRDRNA2_/MRDRNA2_42214_c0_seq1.p1  ORF type:complete len:285 (+),score=76.27 gnl/MRDRNA2_/MRDRNA2_42214_c0_seq1:62-916(+)